MTSQSGTTPATTRPTLQAPVLLKQVIYDAYINVPKLTHFLHEKFGPNFKLGHRTFHYIQSSMVVWIPELLTEMEVEECNGRPYLEKRVMGDETVERISVRWGETQERDVEYGVDPYWNGIPMERRFRSLSCP